MSIVGESIFAVLRGEEWMHDAVCSQTDPEIFHPLKGGSAVEAKRICASCPVRSECLKFALEHRESGIWGGFTDRDRDRLRRGQNPLNKRRSGTAIRPNGHGIACKCFVCRGAA